MALMWDGYMPGLGFNAAIGDGTAAALGISTQFSADTPASFYAFSMGQLQRYLQQRPRISSGSEWDRIMRENTPPAQRGQDRVEVLPPGYDPSRPMGGGAGRSGKTTQTDVAVVEDDCGPLDFGCQLARQLPDDLGKRALLFIVAVLIIAAAVFSFR